MNGGDRDVKVFRTDVKPSLAKWTLKIVFHCKLPRWFKSEIQTDWCRLLMWNPTVSSTYTVKLQGVQLHYVNALPLLKLHWYCTAFLDLLCNRPLQGRLSYRNLPLFPLFCVLSLVGDRWFHISERPPHLYQVSAGKTSVWAREKNGTIRSLII